MLCALVGFIFAVFLPLSLLAYCQSLLAQTSSIELSEAALKAIAMQGGAISSEGFDSLRALVRVCPLGQKDGASLASVSVYYFLLTGVYGICSQICEAIADWAEEERRRCSHFVAVRLDRRIANARKLWVEQMIHYDEQGTSLPGSSRSS